MSTFEILRSFSFTSVLSMTTCPDAYAGINIIDSAKAAAKEMPKIVFVLVIGTNPKLGNLNYSYFHTIFCIIILLHFKMVLCKKKDPTSRGRTITKTSQGLITITKMFVQITLCV
jgi:hypothetical protein